MAPPSITLYDVPSAMPEPWAPNIWRIRFILNYKRLPYRTVWIEFHDVERTLRSINAPPTGQHRDGRPIYSLPVIVDPSRSPGYQPIVLSHANTIAEYLEATYPARPVFPDGSRALQIAFVHFLNDIVLKHFCRSWSPSAIFASLSAVRPIFMLARSRQCRDI